MNNISDELLASFIDGNTSDEQTSQINQIISADPSAFTEFLIASKAICFVDEAEPIESHLPNLGIAASSASIVAGGTLLASYLSHLHDSSPIFGSSENLSYHADRMDQHSHSINENLNHPIMENFVHYGETNHIQQQYDDTCAIKSQQLILNDFGVNVTEDQLVHQAEQFHIYSPGSGTAPQDVGKLLELNGVHCTQHTNATVYDLTSALAQGEKIIIGVDSGELWNNGIMSHFMNQFTDRFVGEQADHALIVAGIDTTSPDDVKVILTDPGTGEEAARYPIAQFLDAWHDSGNFMVTTDNPAPLAYNPEMINFSYSEGHIPMIGAMPYEYFDQHIMPLSQELVTDPTALGILHSDFDGMIGGHSSSFSPDLLSTLEHTPRIDPHHYQTDMNQFHDPNFHQPDANGITFGNQHMADYYNGMAEHHEHLAQFDIDHGNQISAQNNLNYADDYHNHAIDELHDIDQ